ncbi:caspase family protein [Sandarakinorhabdus sp.]|uniref:caspase family protein n=1 Tax=Sandarakinorhabdus sp. TaxID=1916663 RepID=UPI0033419D0F
MRRLLATLALATTLSSGALAENRALLIGVGAYQSPDVNKLPGIDKDVLMMADFSKRLGVAAPVVLMDRAATRDGILAAMKTALTQNVSADDVILIYYSGHGTQVADTDGDEPDGGDEVILGYDTGYMTTANGDKGLRGVINDDEIGQLLRQSPSKNVILMIDACHSGTIDRSAALPGGFQGETRGVSKFFSWSGMGGKAPKAFNPQARAGDAAGSGAYVSLSAAADSEVAQATSTGSVFTVGVTRAIAEKSAGRAITPRDLLNGARVFITQERQTQTPEINGSPDLMDKPLKLTSVADGNGPNWTRIYNTANKLPKVEVSGVKAQYTDGEKLVFDIDVKSDGYLNIVDVGPDDNVTLLFPNKFQPANKVTAGRFTVPASAMPFDLPAGSPYGRSMIVAFLTSAPLSLLTSASDGKTATLASPSLAGLEALGVMTRSFGAAAKADGSGAWAGIAETQVCSRDGGCR